MVSDKGLDELRGELGALDSQLMDLLGKRSELVSRIGRIKEKAGIPTRDYEQEKVVIQRCRTRAENAGVDPDLAESVMLELIRSSLRVQEQQRLASRGDGLGQTALVIGGSGKMGGWFVRFLDALATRSPSQTPLNRSMRRPGWPIGARGIYKRILSWLRHPGTYGADSSRTGGGATTRSGV